MKISECKDNKNILILQVLFKLIYLIDFFIRYIRVI